MLGVHISVSLKFNPKSLFTNVMKSNKMSLKLGHTPEYPTHHTLSGLGLGLGLRLGLGLGLGLGIRVRD